MSSSSAMVHDNNDGALLLLRHNIASLIDEARAVVAMFPGSGVPAHSTADTLRSVELWLEEAALLEDAHRVDSGGSTAPYEAADYEAVLQELRGELEASGVALQMELRSLAARKAYLALLTDVSDWVRATRWETGARQPLHRAERVLVADFCDWERQWAERSGSVSSSRICFLARIEALRAIRGDGGAPATPGSAVAEARFRECARHVVSRAAELQAAVRDDAGVSAEQRRRATTVADDVKAAVDSTTYSAALAAARDDTGSTARWGEREEGEGGQEGPSGFEFLEEQLGRVTEMTWRIAGVAECVALRNQLAALSATLLSAVKFNSRIAEAVGADSVAAICHTVESAEAWLVAHQHASLGALTTLLQELRGVAARHGLSHIESLSDGCSERYSDVTTAINQLQLRAAHSAAVAPAASVSTTAAIDVACSLIEELHILRIELRLQLASPPAPTGRQQYTSPQRATSSLLPRRARLRVAIAELGPQVEEPLRRALAAGSEAEAREHVAVGVAAFETALEELCGTQRQEEEEKGEEEGGGVPFAVPASSWVALGAARAALDLR